MGLSEQVIRSTAAELDKERRYRLAAAMLAGQDTTVLHCTLSHAMNVLYGHTAREEERTAARIVIEMMTVTLLARVDAMDEEFERLLDEVVELRFRNLEEPIDYDSDEGFTIFLNPDDEDVPGNDDLALDLWAEEGTVNVSMRVVREGGLRLTGSLDLEGASELQRGLYLAVIDAEQPQEVEDAEGGITEE